MKLFKTLLSIAILAAAFGFPHGADAAIKQDPRVICPPPKAPGLILVASAEELPGEPFPGGLQLDRPLG